MTGKHAATAAGTTVRMDRLMELWKPSDAREDERRKRRAIILLAAILLAVLAVGIFCLLRPWPAGDDPWGDPSARAGYYDGKTEAQIQADLNAKVAEGMLNISINSIIPVDAQGHAEARIENIAANHSDIKVSIFPTGQPDAVFYESGAIAPGEYIQTIDLSQALEPGTHACTALFTAYDRETHDQTGQAAAEIVVNVQRG